MRRLTRRLRDERGASAVIVAIILVPLLGLVAFTVDVGALYAERGQLQNGADAAALAVAQNCASTPASCVSASTSIAAGYADSNANDSAANTLTPSFPNPHTVVVTTSTRDGSTGDPFMSHPFAAVLGIDTSTVHATAVAEWGSPVAGTIVLPIAMSFCEFSTAVVGSTTKMLIRYDENKTCKKTPTGDPIPGGFGWLERTATSSCTSNVDLDNASAPVEPGNSYPGACDSTMSSIDEKTILVPVYDSAVLDKGKAKSYHLYGFAAFKITGWKFSGGGGMPAVNIDPTAPACTGSCRGIQGYFDRWVGLEDFELGTGYPDLGVSIVQLKLEP